MYIWWMSQLLTLFYSSCLYLQNLWKEFLEKRFHYQVDFEVHIICVNKASNARRSSSCVSFALSSGIHSTFGITQALTRKRHNRYLWIIFFIWKAHIAFENSIQTYPNTGNLADLLGKDSSTTTSTTKPVSLFFLFLLSSFFLCFTNNNWIFTNTNNIQYGRTQRD